MSRESKLDRKLLRRPDTFVQMGREFLETLMKNPKRLTWGLGAIVLLSLAYYGYNQWAEYRLNQDWIAFHRAMEARDEQRVAQLKAVYEKGGSTRAAFMAAASLGDYYYEVAKKKFDSAQKTSSKIEDKEPTLTLNQAVDEAKQWYEKGLRFSLLRPAERELIALDLGHLSELLGNWDDALTRYESVAQAGGPNKALATLHSGRMFEQKKDKAKARELYQSIVSGFANTEYSRLARNYLRQIDSPSFGGSEKP